MAKFLKDPLDEDTARNYPQNFADDPQDLELEIMNEVYGGPEMYDTLYGAPFLLNDSDEFTDQPQKDDSGESGESKEESDEKKDGPDETKEVTTILYGPPEFFKLDNEW